MERFANGQQIHLMYMSCTRTSSWGKNYLFSDLNIDVCVHQLWELIALQWCLDRSGTFFELRLRWGQNLTSMSFPCSLMLGHPVILVIRRLIAYTNQPASVRHCIPVRLCICELGPSLDSFFCATKCIGNKIFWENPGNDDGRVWLYYFCTTASDVC